MIAPVPQVGMQAVNVVFSLEDATRSGSVASQQFTMPDITRRVVLGGAVLAYFRDQDTWTALPYTIGRESEELIAVDYTFTLGYAYDTGFLRSSLRHPPQILQLGSI